MVQTLGEAVAIEAAARQSAQKSTAKVLADVSREKPLTGFIQTYTPDVDDPEGRNNQPAKGDLLQVRTEDLLREMARLLTLPWDLTAAKDWGNCTARADVIIEGTDEPILRDVPVTFLLHLEKQMAEVLAFFRATLVRNPSEDWIWSEEDACWKSRRPEERLRQEKGLKSLVLIEPTQYQPGQAQAVPDEHRTGVWEITQFSGALSRERRTQLIERGEAFLAACRQARVRANHEPAPTQSIGRPVFAFLLGSPQQGTSA